MQREFFVGKLSKAESVSVFLLYLDVNHNCQFCTSKLDQLVELIYEK